MTVLFVAGERWSLSLPLLLLFFLFWFSFRFVVVAKVGKVSVQLAQCR